MTARPPALIHIGGSRYQMASIRWAQEAGLFVVVTDQRADAPGAQMADRFVPVAGDNLEGMQRLAREVSRTHRLVGLWCQADFCLLLQARIHQALGLPGPTPAAVAAALHKHRAKNLWQAQGIATPPGRLAASLPEAEAAVGDLGLPVVLKPVQASGSAGLSRVWKPSELAPAFAHAQAWSPQVLVEAYLQGREFGVNGIFHDQRFYPCGLSERRPGASGVRLEEVIIPAPVAAETARTLYAQLAAAAASLGIREGCVKGDCLLVGDRPYILELAPRLHGNPTLSTALPLATGANPLRAYFGLLAGEKDPRRHLRPRGRPGVAGYRPLFGGVGRVAAIAGLEEVRALPGVVQVDLFIQPGQRLNGHPDNRGIVGYVFARAASADRLRQILATAQSTLEIVME